MVWASQVVLIVKNPPASAGDSGDTGSIPGSGRSPGEVNGNPLQYSCLENTMDRGAWQATVHGRGGGHKRVRHDWATKQLNNNSNSKSTVNLNCQTVLHKSCIILHSQQQSMKVPISRHSHQRMLFFICFFSLK